MISSILKAYLHNHLPDIYKHKEKKWKNNTREQRGKGLAYHRGEKEIERHQSPILSPSFFHLTKLVSRQFGPQSFEKLERIDNQIDESKGLTSMSEKKIRYEDKIGIRSTKPWINNTKY